MITIKQGIEQVNEILDKVYGSGDILNSNSVVTLWATEHLTDVELAKKVIRVINIKRYNLGLVGLQVPYGHRFF